MVFKINFGVENNTWARKNKIEMEDMYKNPSSENSPQNKISYFPFIADQYVCCNSISSSHNHFGCRPYFEWENYFCKETYSNENGSASSWVHYLDL